ncbi:MAG: DUF3987 domain-containing protein [Desulfobacterales bacterium]|nr:DUF3987 domain-containing protein [Desulfobacterales bacterium]MDD4071663.1 DUF3987 domain-containing protein [Desulfobacterales bacterium]MDD4393574.1 DUF3987 domain-containing protein [Desulfobacterales bacterium]
MKLVNPDKRPGKNIPEPIQPGGLYTTDYTIEALFRDQPLNAGTMIINDEASVFFDGQNQYKSGGKGTDRQGMLKLYDGKRARKIRVKDTLTLEGSRINIAGGTQPSVFKRVFNGDGNIFNMVNELNLDMFAEMWSAPFVARKEVGKFSGGILNPRTLANADSLGAGPEGRIKIGNTVAYPTKSLVRYMKKRARLVPPKNNGGVRESNS